MNPSLYLADHRGGIFAAICGNLAYDILSRDMSEASVAVHELRSNPKRFHLDSLLRNMAKEGWDGFFNLVVVSELEQGKLRLHAVQSSSEENLFSWQMPVGWYGFFRLNEKAPGVSRAYASSMIHDFFK